MDDSNDARPFPIQQEYGRDSRKSCTVPWWLAEIAYKHYSKLFGSDQSLKRLAERGGFGRSEFLYLLRKENPIGGGSDHWKEEINAGT